MMTCIREVRRAKGMTLQDVAIACVPPTTAQTIGRLETGTRTVSVAWLNRIAAALGVVAADLVTVPERSDLPVAALLSPSGAKAPRREQLATPPAPAPGQVAIGVAAAVGDYLAGDLLWCDRIGGDALGQALGRELLVPCGAGRFLFGRLEEVGEGAVMIVPVESPSRPRRAAIPAWAALPRLLVRDLMGQEAGGR